MKFNNSFFFRLLKKKKRFWNFAYNKRLSKHALVNKAANKANNSSKHNKFNK
jgi:hypothetical protein